MLFDKYFEVHDAKSKIDLLLNWSLKLAVKKQKMYQELCKAIPDISNQYSNPDGMNCMDEKSADYAPFYAFKVRAQHTFRFTTAFKCYKNTEVMKHLACPMWATHRVIISDTCRPFKKIIILR